MNTSHGIVMNTENEKKRLTQEMMLERLLKEPKPTEMLTVYLSNYEKCTHNYGIHPALIPIDQKDEILEKL